VNDARYEIGVECSNPSVGCGVAMARRTATALEHIETRALPRGASGTDALVGTIAEMTRDHGVAPRRVARIAVSTGPGGYTALRTSVASSSAMARALACELVGVPTPMVAARALAERHLPAMVILASKGGGAHASIVARDRSVRDLGLVGADAVDARGVRTLACDAHAPGGFVEGAARAGIAVEPLALDAWSCLVAAGGLGPVDPADLRVIYAREPDAVTQWRGRRDGRGG